MWRRESIYLYINKERRIIIFIQILASEAFNNEDNEIDGFIDYVNNIIHDVEKKHKINNVSSGVTNDQKLRVLIEYEEKS